MDPRHSLQYWGKAGAAGEFHPLAYHALHVAACGMTLLERHWPLRDLLRARLGLPETMLCL